ncbi:MAG TPA: zinc-binding dehydrogenase [Pirellulales bacterium]|nr:zinc-binding dehydrogenase [Pirellulales bacterium]
MRAILRRHFGGPEVLEIREMPEPEPKAGHAVIEVKAFGLNHAELHMRKGEWAEIADVSGIECVGIIKSCPGGEFPVGAKVAALMGGLGRTINGSYAEYTRAPVSNIALIDADLPWAELAAIPETYATAWTCLYRNLEIQRGQLLVIRGATSSFGQAALKMAVNAGLRVIATTRNPERFTQLEKLGAERCEIERPDLSKHIPEAKKIDAILDLVGNTVLLDSLAMLRRGGTTQPTSTTFLSETPYIDQILVPLTTRIRPETANTLKRVCLEQKLNRRWPDSAQEIVDLALSQWFAKEGIAD